MLGGLSDDDNDCNDDNANTSQNDSASCEDILIIMLELITPVNIMTVTQQIMSMMSMLMTTMMTHCL